MAADADLTAPGGNAGFGAIEALLMLIILVIFSCVLVALILEAGSSAETDAGAPAPAVVDGR